MLLMDLDFISKNKCGPDGDRGQSKRVIWDAPLVAWAADQGVPILSICQSETKKAKQQSLAVCRETIFCNQLNPLDDSKLRARLAELRRPRLLVAGGPLETALAFSALSALELGYDVYLIHDMTWSASSTLADIVTARLLQAGVVPVIAPQLLCEWQRDESQSP